MNTVGTLDLYVRIQRTEPGRRVVLGEVMIPAPAMKAGDRVAKESLDGRIHFDGAYMTAPEIVRLADRFATKRPSIDINHDGQMIAAEVVESFIAGPNWEPWAQGAWVVGAKVRDDSVWERINDGELGAFSIQFLVRIREVPVTIVETLADGAQVERKVTLFEFSNGDPQLLSIVGKPATGAYFKGIQRGIAIAPGDLEIAPESLEWDAAGAKARVDDWADGSIERIAQAHAYYDAERGAGMQIADVVDDRLVVVRQALTEALERAPSIDESARGRVVNHLDTYLANLAEEDSMTIRNGTEIETDDDAMIAELRQLANNDPEALRALVERARAGEDVEPGASALDAAAAATEEPPEADVVINDEGDAVAVGRTDDPQDAPKDAEAAPAPESDEDADTDEPSSVLRTFLGSLKSLLGMGGDEDDSGPAPADESTTDDEDAGPVVRQFNDVIAAGEINDQLWRGWDALRQTFGGILASDDVEDKPAALKVAANQFSTWLMGVVDALGAVSFSFANETPRAEETQEAPTAEAMFEALEASIVGRAGKKMAKKRLKRLKAALAELNALLADLDDTPPDDAKRSEPEADADASPEDAEPAPPAAAEQAIAGLVSRFETLADSLESENKALRDRIRSLESARPAPAGGSDDGPGGAGRTTPERIVAPVFFPRQ